MAVFCIEKEAYALYQECLECEDKLCNYFFCLVVGSRDFCNYEVLKQKLDSLLQNKEKVIIVSGGARGADTLAKQYAVEKGYRYKEFPANWELYGKKAGFIRNEEMHKYIAKAKDRGCVAFWDGKSKGTKQNFSLAKQHNNQIKVIYV